MGDNGKKGIEFSEEMEISKAVEYLNALRASLSAGTVCVQQGGESVTVHPEKFVTLEVKARQKDNKESIAFSLEWRKRVTSDSSSHFKITHEEPEPEADTEEEPEPAATS
jgi:amphi-Trp domain-containing protein